MTLTPTSTFLKLLSQTTGVPLTTLFTPPWSCTNAVPWKVYYLKEGWHDKTSLSFPAGCNPPAPANPSRYFPSGSVVGSSAAFFIDYQLQQGFYYSPGVCPYKYNYVATSTARDLHTGGEPITLAICCPPHMSSWNGIKEFVCEQVLSSSDTEGFWSSIFAHIDTTSLPGMTVQAQPISVAWQAADLPLFTPSAAPAVALAVQTGASAIPTFFTQSTPPTLSTSDGVSPASSATSTDRGPLIHLSRKAALGVGVLIGLIPTFLFIIVYFTCLRRTRHAKRARLQNNRDIVMDPSSELGRSVPPPYASLPEVANSNHVNVRHEVNDIRRQSGRERDPRARAELRGGGGESSNAGAELGARSLSEIFELGRSRQSSRARAELTASPRLLPG